MKRRVKILVDIAMFVLFLYLMGYRAGSGLLSHGVLGCLLFALFIAHHLLNIKWYCALPRGKYPFARKLFIAIDFVLLADMGLMAVSSVMMSGEVFAFSPVPMTQLGRDLHVGSTAWGFLLMALHLGLHTHGPLRKLERKVKESAFAYSYVLFYGLVLLGGIFCVWRSGLWHRMLLESRWQSAYSPAVFYGEYLLIVAGMCLLVHLVFRVKEIFARKKM